MQREYNFQLTSFGHFLIKLLNLGIQITCSKIRADTQLTVHILRVLLLFRRGSVDSQLDRPFPRDRSGTEHLATWLFSDCIFNC